MITCSKKTVQRQDTCLTTMVDHHSAAVISHTWSYVDVFPLGIPFPWCLYTLGKFTYYFLWNPYLNVQGSPDPKLVLSPHLKFGLQHAIRTHSCLQMRPWQATRNLSCQKIQLVPKTQNCSKILERDHAAKSQQSQDRTRVFPNPAPGSSTPGCQKMDSSKCKGHG